jgi:UDP:flavonoid glycosyltransferase YjiC (YdhE family)
VFAIRDLTYAYSLLHLEGFDFFRAPECPVVSSGATFTASYAEILMLAGFLKPEILAAQLIGWRSIFDAVKPNLLILDSAPGASLAARALPIPTFRVSNGFGCPPDSEIWPGLPVGQKLSVERLRQSEKTALDAANGAASLLNIPKLVHLGELYPSDTTYIANLPELDHYERTDANFIGALAMTSEGVSPQWPVSLGVGDAGDPPPKIFAYLKSNYVGLDTVLEALSKLPVQTIAFIPGLSENNRRKWNSANLWISDQALRVDQCLIDADILLCHGGNLIEPALLAGVPSFLLPMQLEQTMICQRAKLLGVAAICEKEALANFKKQLRDFLRDSKYEVQAKSFAARNSSYKTNLHFNAFIERVVNSH